MRDTWKNHVVGPCNRQENTRHIVEGVNTSLTFHVSRICEIRARELDIETHEVARSKNVRRKVNITSQGFVKGRCQGWTLEPMKVRVAKGASAHPS
jgi:hypothetical protein